MAGSVALLILCGCVDQGPAASEAGLDWLERPCTAQEANDPGARPDVLLHDGESAHRFRWDAAQDTYRHHGQGPAGTRGLAGMDGTAYTATSESPYQVLALDASMRQVASVALERPATALAAADGILWVATNWTLVAFDAQLQELGRVATPPEHGDLARKMVDHIVVREGRAYQIDDVVMPFYGFLVDVADPGAMRLLDTVEVTGSSSPSWHWVDPGRTWWIQTNFGGQGGASTGADVFDVRSGRARDAGHVRLWSLSYPPGQEGPSTQSGLALHATTAVTPIWAVLDDGDGYRFQNILLEDRPVLACSRPLPIDPFPGFGEPRTTLHQRGDIVLGTVGNQLLVWAVDGEPRLVHGQDLAFVAKQVALA